jgi:DNA-binding GntR family transcriptional regulator
LRRASRCQQAGKGGYGDRHALDAPGAALYRQLAGELRERILSHDIPPGTRLPSEPELVERYSVSRNTVRLALGLLRDEGLVITGQGRGSFAVEPPDTAMEPDSDELAEREDLVLSELHAIRDELRHLRDRLDQLAGPEEGRGAAE